MNSRVKMLRHRVHRLSQVSAREHALLAEATLQLIAARCALATTPFPSLARRMGGFVAPLETAPPPSPADQATAREIGWAVTRAGRHLPFAAVCLPQAMAARAMLRRRGIAVVIHFGTMRGGTLGIAAHAWTSVGPVEVTGYPIGEAVAEIACLVD